MPPEPFLLSRRDVVLSLGAGAAMFALPSQATALKKIVTLDYASASTLLALGVTPTAISELADWDRWVQAPAMPAGVIDLGSSWEANFEILIELKPDLILTSPYLDGLLPKLEAIGPVLKLEVYTPDTTAVLPAAIAATRKLATAIDREPEAERFLATSEAFFDACRARLAKISAPPLAIVSLMDARHARIFGRPGLYNNVLERIGLENAWTAQNNYWGFETIAIEDLSRLSDPRTQMIALEPVPGDVLPKLKQSPLWQALPFARPGQFSTLPPTLLFGMVNEAVRFARLVTDLLEAQHG